MRRARPSLLLLAAAVLGATSGCAGVGRLTSTTNGIDSEQQQRATETIADFEEKREHAELMAAQARWREGNLAACRQGLDELLSRDPTHMEARALLIQVLLSEEKYDVARGYLEQVLAARPADAWANHTMGLVLQMQGSDAEALTYFRRAAELQPDNQEFALSRRALELACAASHDACRVGDHDKAGGSAICRSGTQCGTDACTDCSPGKQCAVETCGECGPHKPGSAETAAAGDAASPATSEANRALTDAEEALKTDNVQDARDLLTRAVSLGDASPRIAIRAAVVALRQRHPELAGFVLQPLAERYRDSAALHRTLGTAYYRQGDYQGALSAFEQALSLDNSNGLSYLLMGCTLEKMGQADQARSHFEQAGRLDPRLRVQR